MLGREVRLPAEIVFNSNTTRRNETVASYGEYVDILRSRIQKAHEVARNYLGVAAKRQKKNYDSRTMVHDYAVGDLVWYLQENRQKAVCPKLQPAYDGPLVVSRKISNLNYVIQINKEGKTKTVHHDKLKPYLGNSPSKWAQQASLLYCQPSAVSVATQT